MKLTSVFIKSLREQWRNPLVPALTLAFAPFFVGLIALFFPPGGSTSYRIVVVNRDVGAQNGEERINLGDQATAALSAVTYRTGAALLEVLRATSPERAAMEVRERRAVLYVVFPTNFTRQLQAARTGDAAARAAVVFGGDLTNPYYALTAVLATSAIDAFVRQTVGTSPPVVFQEEALGASDARTEFELYVPGLLIFAIGLSLFNAAMCVAREIESHTLQRLVLTPMTAVDLLGGISLSQILLALLAEALAFLTAVAFGFRSFGPIWLALPIGILTSVSIIGMGMVVAALSKSVAEAFVLANFPFGLIMFLSGTLFPVQGLPIGIVGGQTLNLLDVLPPRHAVNAMGKVFTLGMGWSDIGYELGALTVLSFGFYALGLWLFTRRFLRPPLAVSTGS